MHGGLSLPVSMAPFLLSTFFQSFIHSCFSFTVPLSPYILLLGSAIDNSYCYYSADSHSVD